MEIKEGDYILGIWFGPSAVKQINADYLLTIVRRGDKWEGEYRIRFIKDEIRDETSQDVKKFYSFQSDANEKSEADVMKDIVEMVNKLKPLFHIKFYPVRGGFEDFIKVMKKMDFATVREIGPEDEE